MAAKDTNENLYSILNCDSTSSQEELKRSYQRLVKEYHPDKQAQVNDTEFIRLHNAWKVLGDVDSRKKYDAELTQKQLHSSLLYAELVLNELKFDEELLEYSYQCRCGGIYKIELEDVSDDMLVECDECSLNILIRL